MYFRALVPFLSCEPVIIYRDRVRGRPNAKKNHTHTHTHTYVYYWRWGKTGIPFYVLCFMAVDGGESRFSVIKLTDYGQRQEGCVF